MGSAMLCGVTGIAPAIIENSAAYLRSWISVLKGERPTRCHCREPSTESSRLHSRTIRQDRNRTPRRTRVNRRINGKKEKPMNSLTAIRSFAKPGFCPVKRTRIFADRWYKVTFQNVETDPTLGLRRTRRRRVHTTATWQQGARSPRCSPEPLQRDHGMEWTCFRSLYHDLRQYEIGSCLCLLPGVRRALTVERSPTGYPR